MPGYTRPEKGTERAIARAVREALKECGGCCYCTHRAGLFEGSGTRDGCGLAKPLAFPQCVEAQGGFEFDEGLYQEGRGGA